MLLLYLIDQLKLQFIFCYEGLQWCVISDGSVKVSLFFVLKVYSGMLYLIDQLKLQFIFCYEGLQWYVISDRSVKVTVCFLL